MKFKTYEAVHNTWKALEKMIIAVQNDNKMTREQYEMVKAKIEADVAKTFAIMDQVVRPKD